jgi:DNA (cytosine-5)-methyltransferase 1
MRKKINQLDLFSGIGGFHLGLERAGYKVKSYFSEVDKHAIAVYKHQFKDAEYVGSVTDVRGEQLPKIDIITFGSPCQDFSLAGKRKGMGGQRSSLILEAIRLIEECRPGVFIWENVKGTFSSNAGEDFAAILQAFTSIGGYRLEWELLNTSWFLPQNRERIYLVGYSTRTKRDWRGIFPIGTSNGENIGQWSQIREASKPVGHRGTGGQQGKVYSDQGLSPTISAYTSADPTFIKENYTAQDIRGNEFTPTIRAGGRHVFTKKHSWDVVIEGNEQDIEVWKRNGTKVSDDIAPTLTGGAGNSGGNHSDMACLKVKSATKRGYEEAQEGDSVNLSQPNSETRRGRVGKGKANTLETSCNQGVVQPVQIGQSTKTFAHKSGTIVGKEGQDAFTIRSSNPNGVKVEANKVDHNVTGFRIRRLTPIECERLQGFPDNHTALGVYDGEIKEVSNTQRYKMCGNAVTVDVVHAVAERIKEIL